MNEELIELIKNNPDLPIYAWVDAEICGDGYGYWLGKFGRAYIKEYAKVEPYNYYGKDYIFKDDHEEYYEWLINKEHYLNMKLYDADREITHHINNLDYKKAIFVYIETPDNF